MSDTKTKLSVSLAKFYTDKGAKKAIPESPANSIFWKMFLDIPSNEVESMLSLYRMAKSINDIIANIEPRIITS